MGNLLKAHIFKQRIVGMREEVKLKLFHPDDTPFDVDAGASFDAASARFSAMDNSADANHEFRMGLRTSDDEAFSIYSGTWARVPESAAEAESDYYVGSLRLPGPGLYLVAGRVQFFTNSLEDTAVSVEIHFEGGSDYRIVTCHNTGPISFGGVPSAFPEVPFSQLVDITPECFQYMYAQVDIEDNKSFEGRIVPRVLVNIVRLMPI
jgi:hypothetical protein